ncbi:MAG: hypothetical protein RLZZ293_823 [Pseudomonadota bacterium]
MLMTKIRPLLLSANWNAPPTIKTIITTCHDNFNLALHVGDDPERVMRNREVLHQYSPPVINWLNQIHSTIVIEANAQTANNLNDADASYTTKQGIACVVMTADCLPILLTNLQGDFVAAIHAGWRGLNNGIITNTLEQLKQFDRSNILAFIGPAIGQECFEIGSEVREEFLDQNYQLTGFFKPSINSGKFMADLRQIAAYQLIQLGLKAYNISNSNICTHCHHKWFFSYRHKQNTGRIATLIWKE